LSPDCRQFLLFELRIVLLVETISKTYVFGIERLVNPGQ